jgi:hypothetical protein
MIAAAAVFESAKRREDLSTMRRALSVAKRVAERREEAIVAAGGPAPAVVTSVIPRGYGEHVVQPDPPRVLSGEPRCGICKSRYVDADARVALVKVRAAGGSVLSACARCRRNNPRLQPA